MTIMNLVPNLRLFPAANSWNSPILIESSKKYCHSSTQQFEAVSPRDESGNNFNTENLYRSVSHRQYKIFAYGLMFSLVERNFNSSSTSSPQLKILYFGIAMKLSPDSGDCTS